MSDHPCPWWLCFTFDNPLRKAIHNPDRILAGLVQPGQTALDIGCGMGYFTLPLARLVGSAGRVIAADLQPQMLAGVRRRAANLGLADRITLLRCQPERIGLDQPVDFALLFWMLHEVRDRWTFLSELAANIRPGGNLLLVEPRLLIGQGLFEGEVAQLTAAGFHPEHSVGVRFSYSILFSRPTAQPAGAA